MRKLASPAAFPLSQILPKVGCPPLTAGLLDSWHRHCRPGFSTGQNGPCSCSGFHTSLTPCLLESGWDLTITLFTSQTCVCAPPTSPPPLASHHSLTYLFPLFAVYCFLGLNERGVRLGHFWRPPMRRITPRRSVLGERPPGSRCTSVRPFESRSCRGLACANWCEEW